MPAQAQAQVGTVPLMVSSDVGVGSLPGCIAPGELLGGRYELRSLLGVGGMAEVYRARDLRLNRDVAVKLFDDRTLDDPLTLTRARAETRIMARLSHPHLVGLYDAHFPEAGTPVRFRGARPRAYLVMELVSGPVLSAAIRDLPMPPREVAQVGAGLAAALAYVHSAGVVHRDLKPANVLLSADGTAKLADFGIAVLGEDSRHTSTGVIVGTAGYLAPEQIRGGPATTASDVHALGLVLLECLTGQREYLGTGVQSAVARLHRPPALPADLPVGWPELLMGLTDDDPDRRPSAAQAAAELQELASTRPAAVGVAVVAAGTPRRWAVPVAAAAVALSAIGAVAVLSGATTPPPATSTRAVPDAANANPLPQLRDTTVAGGPSASSVPAPPPAVAPIVEMPTLATPTAAPAAAAPAMQPPAVQPPVERVQAAVVAPPQTTAVAPPPVPSAAGVPPTAATASTTAREGKSRNTVHPGSKKSTAADDGHGQSAGDEGD